jgi:hypothetical protein
MTENGWGKERKINGESATANQVRDGHRELKQKCSQTGSAIKKLLSMQPLQRAYCQILMLSRNHVFTLRTEPCSRDQSVFLFILHNMFCNLHIVI